jgi:multicomponent Na+:H+ antiporter subunit G
MKEVLALVLLFAGSIFTLLAAVGLGRMPDLLTRMHATSKAGTLGSGLMLLAAAVHYGEFGLASRAVAAVVFIALTAPVAAHMIARAAYLLGVNQWEGSVVDELAGRYDRSTHALGRPKPKGEPSSPRPR